MSLVDTADRPSDEPRSPRLLRTFWRKIKGAFTPRSLPPINCKATRVLRNTSSTPTPDKDEPPISPVSPVSPLSPVFFGSLHTFPADGPKAPKCVPVERAWYTDASLSSPTPPFAREEESRRESTSSTPHSSQETVQGGAPHHISTLRAISTPYLFPFPSTEPATRRTGSTGWIWERVAEVGTHEVKHTS